MKTNLKMGVWLDHSVAYLFDMSDSTTEALTVKADIKHHEGNENMRLDESMMQNKEQDQLSDYFKRLTEIIQKWDDVVLFGPTDAKTELLNFIHKNHHSVQTNMVVKQAGKMTENQMLAFVRLHFGIL